MFAYENKNKNTTAQNVSGSEDITRKPGVKQVSYTVQNGDSAFSVAQKNGVDVNQLLSLNGMHFSKNQNGNLIVVQNDSEQEHVFHPGDIIQIPKTSEVSKNAEPHWSIEKQYEIALALNEYDPAKVIGYDEFKKGGYRYNPSKLYNQKTIYKQQYGVVPEQIMGAYKDMYFDSETHAGKTMNSQLMKAKGADYKPSPELLASQIVEQKGDDQAKKDIMVTLRKSSLVLDAINRRLRTGKDDPQTTRKLRRLGLQIFEGILKICDVLKRGNKEHPAPLADPVIIAKAENLRTAAGHIEIQKAELLPYSIVLEEAFELGLELGTLLFEAAIVSTLVLSLVVVTEQLVEDIEHIDISELTDLLKEPKLKPKPKPASDPATPPVTTDDDDACEPKPLGYHKGDTDNEELARYTNTKRANEIADTRPPNRPDPAGRLGDWKVQNVAFDALAVGKKELWEVKAHNYSNYSEDIKAKSLKSIEKTLDRELPVASACGYDFVLALIDKQQEIDFRIYSIKYRTINIKLF